MLPRVVLLSVISPILLFGCATSEPELTPLEIQSMQTRHFEAPKEIVFPSTVSVFQNLGYTLQSADLETGIITAESAADSNSWYLALTGSSSVEQTRATAFIEERGADATVRLNFVVVKETSGAWGQRNRDDTPILNAEIYQNAFERIDTAVFTRSAD